MCVLVWKYVYQVCSVCLQLHSPFIFRTILLVQKQFPTRQQLPLTQNWANTSGIQSDLYAVLLTIYVELLPYHHYKSWLVLDFIVILQTAMSIVGLSTTLSISKFEIMVD